MTRTVVASTGVVRSVNVARAQPLALQEPAAAAEADGPVVLSATRKRPVPGAVTVHPLGLDGDEQADPSVHGGLDKAVYAYPVEHHDFWRTVRAQARVAEWNAPLPAGLLGENLTLEGLTESSAWIGDLLRFPNCALAVSQPRQPCDKFNAAMGFRHAAKLMVQSGWCGFYLAVREPGTIAAGDPFTVVPGPREVRIDELFRATLSGRRMD